MKPRSRIFLKGVGTVLTAAGFANAGVGSVISSFPWGANVRAIYRDDSYVYGVVFPNNLVTYTTTGSVVKSVTLSGLVNPADADHSTLGAGYIDVIDGPLMKTYNISTGSLVRSVAVSASGYAYAPGGAYVYYLNMGYVGVYTTSGSLVTSFSTPYASGSLAAATDFNNYSGNYVLVGTTSNAATLVYTASGSLLTSFTVPTGVRGTVCGKGAPASYRTTYWVNNGSATYMYQIDLGNTAIGVAPVPFGYIKALLR